MLVELLVNSAEPLSAIDIIESFKQKNNPVNKTTVYRELDTLMTANLVKEIDFGEGKKRYELDTNKHHHHLVCLNCKKSEDVELQADLDKEEQRVEKETGFEIKSHSLEFFGLCKNCQQY